MAIAGDFSAWTPTRGQARRLEPLDVWLWTSAFPADARLDYKLVIDGDRWVLDPANPLRQLSGYGDNSELRMPGYEPSPYVTAREGVPRGELSEPLSIESAALGHAVSYQVYTPAGYEELERLPSLYVTDGHEYAHPDMGSLPIVLDNLIAEARIRPGIAVFIDPRTGQLNRRGEQYVMSEPFLEFVTRELVPAVDAAYRTAPEQESRVILGTSLGGLNAAWFALRGSDVFGGAAAQSPAFDVVGGALLEAKLDPLRYPVRIHVSCGKFHDSERTTRLTATVLAVKGYDLKLVTTSEGHSWGQWRALLDDVLLFFWGTKGR